MSTEDTMARTNDDHVLEVPSSEPRRSHLAHCITLPNLIAVIATESRSLTRSPNSTKRRPLRDGWLSGGRHESGTTFIVWETAFKGFRIGITGECVLDAIYGPSRKPRSIMSWIETVILGLAVAGSCFPAPLETARARILYQRGEFVAALAILKDDATEDAATLLLKGQCHYMLGEAKTASIILEKAVALAPQNADFHLWLGRAYGRRAETSNFLVAAVLAAKARQSFEAAVKLAPNNLEAISDLFEYYLEAPTFLGGGVAKAAELSNRVKDLDPAEYEYDQARLTEKQKQFASAELHYRRAAELAPGDPGRLTDLGEFLAARGQYDESDRAFARAREVAPNKPAVLFQTAKVLMRFHRKVETACILLKRYLSSPLTPDDPPRYEAVKLLEQASAPTGPFR